MQKAQSFGMPYDVAGTTDLPALRRYVDAKRKSAARAEQKKAKELRQSNSLPSAHSAEDAVAKQRQAQYYLRAAVALGVKLEKANSLVANGDLAGLQKLVSKRKHTMCQPTQVSVGPEIFASRSDGLL